MSDKAGIAIISSVALLLVIVLCLVFVKCEKIFEDALLPDNNAVSEINHPETENSTAADLINQDKTASPSAGKSAQTSKDINAAGKIVEAFLSPYNANTKYKNIYLNNKTGTNIDLAALYNDPPKFKINKTSGPEVLVLHTHATEGFMTDEKSTYTAAEIGQIFDESKSVIRLGDIICDQLAEYGITAIHDKTLHDNPSYTKSYARAAETTQSYLKKYPTIKVVIDIHRDSVSTDGGEIKPTVEINGKKAAQIMFVAGSETGNVTGFPDWRENLKLVLRLQELSENLYPGFARSIYFTSKKYNQHLSKGSLLIEIGGSVNTVKEAEYSAELLGKILGAGLSMFAE